MDNIELAPEREYADERQLDPAPEQPERGRFYQRSEFIVQREEEPDAFGGDETGLREAAAALRRERESDPVIRRNVGELPSSMKLNEAADALYFTKQMETAQELVNHGLTLQEAVEAAAAGEHPPIELDYRDGRKPDEEVGLRQAAKDLADYHEAQRLAREAAEQPLEQPSALEPQQPTEPTEAEVRAQEEAAALERVRAANEAALAAEQQGQLIAAWSQMGAEEQTAWTQAAQLRNAFSDIKSTSDLEFLSNTNPQRAQQFLAADKAVIELESRARQLGELRQAREISQREQQFNELRAFKAQQDDLADAAIPELRDERAPAFRETAKQLAKEFGITQEVMTHPILGRAVASVEFQKLMADAIRYRQMRESTKNLADHRKPVPGVQRPGTAFLPSERRDGSAIEQLGRRLAAAPNTNQGARIGAQLLKAQRAARAS
jgi:hypothetical protein